MKYDEWITCNRVVFTFKIVMFLYPKVDYFSSLHIIFIPLINNLINIKGSMVISTIEEDEII